MIRKGMIALALLMGAALSTQGFCQEQAVKQGQTPIQKVKIATGTVEDIDWVAGQFMVRTTDTTAPEELTFMVPGDTPITKGTETIGFADINLSNTVTVEYVQDPDLNLKALRIMVEEN